MSRSRIQTEPGSEETRLELLPVATLVMWLGCLIVGLAGLHFTLAPPAKSVQPIRPTEAALVKVTLVNSAAPTASVDQPPPLPAEPQLPPLPPMPVAAALTPEIPFAVLVQGPVRIVPKAAAVLQPSTLGPHSDVPVYKEIFFGKGEGSQPAPEYPLECQLAGQGGTVGVEFDVAENGSVTSARVTKPCQWPLLNQAAARSIRETWNYPAGPLRHLFIKIVYVPKSQ
jgi:TonB family protein